MSEEDENMVPINDEGKTKKIKTKAGTTITVDVTDVNKNVEALKKDKESLQTSINIIAEKLFNEKRNEVAEELGLDPDDIETPEELKSYQIALEKQKATKSTEKKTGAGGIPLTGAQYGSPYQYSPATPMSERDYDNQLEMLLDLEHEAKNSQLPHIKREAQKSLSQLWKKSLKSLDKGGEAVFEGEITKAIPKKAHETPEEKAERKEEASKWRIKK